MSDLDQINQDNHFFYENAFNLTAPAQRMGKFLTQFDLFSHSRNVEGAIVEVGVFKGASFSRFAKFRKLLCPEKALVGFDIFGRFPRPDNEEVTGDIVALDNFVDSAGEFSISRGQLLEFLKASDCDNNTTLVKGDVLETLPRFCQDNPDYTISFLNIDVDLYDPTKTCLETLFERVNGGGVILLDDYNGFPGATQAIDEFLATRGLSDTLQSSQLGQPLHYLIKE